MAASLPNAITLARLLSVPLCIWLLLGERYGAAFWVFAAAGISDALDGFIAKRFGLTSALGAVLDPLADKALLVSVYVVMGIEGLVATWLVILIAFRDLMILGGAIVLRLFADHLPLAPTLLSKANTTAQIILAASLLAEYGLGVGLGRLLDVLVWAVAASTAASFVGYLFAWVALMKAPARAGRPDATPPGDRS
ncbi:MAG: CDP-alcohol phosphatidyltransferase family protein [Alphaproteobacteria bacterium]|nr:CDP-alcohol phosphatidyltransferase family protein [Alphaproteobacteria bacterium]